VCKKASFPDATSSVTVNIYSGTLSTPNDSLNPCFIPANASSCDVTLSWNTINPPVGFTSAVTTDPGITVLAANSSPGTQYPVNGNPGNRVFYLYNSGNELAKVTAYAECTPGTSWVAGKCSSGGGTHTVTYAANGGIGVLPATATYDVGDTVTVAPQGVLLN